MSTLNALLAGLVDFAGLFPPAALDMRPAVLAYAGYRTGPHARVLGAFVVPASRLDEFGAELERLGAGAEAVHPWAVSVIASDAVDSDIARALRLGPTPERTPSTTVVAIELKADTAAGVARATALVPRSMAMAAEIPLSLGRDDRRSVLTAVRSARRMAKIRTGGVTPESIPSPAQVAEFIWDCARAGVPFKATAGLHHPIRAEHFLTYAPDSPRAVVHGFVNVFMASAAAWVAAQSDEAARTADPPARVIGLLQEADPASFSVDGDTIRWRDAVFTAADMARSRRGLARSFGSCSFAEPIAELEALGWIPRQQGPDAAEN
ncbi:MAG: hypothetical protein R6V57_15620 [Vicinamibacterales bacterium]